MPEEQSYAPIPTAAFDPSEEARSTVDATASFASTADGPTPLAGMLDAAPTISGYAVTAEIARGGMGRIYSAVDSTLDREVAIKTLLPGAKADRFVTESKITAKLPHPGIPPVHALGTLPDGSPYLVMKLVKGRTLADLLKERASPADDLTKFVQIFEQIAQAVGFAHEQGVIHRDLKPLNVMVGAFGEVQVMDWGLAKELTASRSNSRHDVEGAEYAGDDLSLTSAGTIMGTPGYMAPEQARGEAVDARADVFALGATLAAILTGSPAFVGTTGRETIEKAARGDLADVLNRLDASGVDAELVAIAKKCLAAAADDRPSDASAVAMHAAAHRTGVEARLRRAETEAAEAVVRETEQRKRRRVLLASAVTISLALTVGLGISLWQMNRAVAAESQAKGRLTQIENGNEILASIFADLDVRQAKDGLEPLEAVLAARLVHAGEQLESEAVGDSLSVARLQSRLAVALMNLARGPEAIKLLLKAGETLSDQLGLNHPDTLTNMSRLASAYHIAGQPTDALTYYEEALRRRKATLGNDHADTISSMAGLAAGYYAVGRLQEAVPLFEESLRLQKSTIGTDHGEALTNMTNLAAGYQSAGRVTEALPLYEEALRIRREKLGPHHADTLASMNNLAMGYRDAGMVDKSLPLLEETLKVHRTRLGADHQYTLASMANLAQGYRSAGKLDRALPLFEQSFQSQRTLLGADHPDTLVTMNGLASAYRDAAKLKEGISLLEDAVKLQEAKLGADHPQTLTGMATLGSTYYDAGRIADASKVLEEALSRRRLKLGKDHPETLSSMNSLAAVYYASGRLDRALPLFEETLTVQKAKLGLEHPDTLLSMSNLGFVYHAAQQPDKALPLLEESLALRKRILGPDHPYTLTSMNNLALGYQAAGKLDKALPLFEETFRRQKAAGGPAHPGTLNTMANLASAYLASGRSAEAVKLQEEALSQQKSLLGTDHPDTINTMASLGMCYRQVGRLPDAIALLEQAAAGIERRGFQHQHAGKIIGFTVAAEQAAKQFDRAESWLRKWGAAVKTAKGAASLEYGDQMYALGENLLFQKRWKDAADTLRECSSIRTKTHPDAWTTFAVDSLLGAALLGQTKYADAEPLLLKGYEGMKQREKSIPAEFRNQRLSDAVDRLIELYAATNKPDGVKKWRAEREKFLKANTPAPLETQAKPLETKSPTMK